MTEQMEAQVTEQEDDSLEVQETPTGGESQSQDAGEQHQGPKGVPSDREAYKRVSQELKETLKQLRRAKGDNEMLLDRQSRLEERLASIERGFEQEEPPDLDLADDDYVTGEQTKKVVSIVKDEITTLKDEIGSLKTELLSYKQATLSEKIQQIDDNGRERFDDWDMIANKADEILRRNPSMYNEVINAKDPAVFVYNLGGGLVQKKPNKARKIAENDSYPKTLTNVTDGADKGASLTFEQIQALPADQWAKVPEEVREKARLEYQKRQGLKK